MKDYVIKMTGYAWIIIKDGKIIAQAVSEQEAQEYIETVQ